MRKNHELTAVECSNYLNIEGEAICTFLGAKAPL